MRDKAAVRLTALLLFAGIGVLSYARGADPNTGTWKLNVAESKFNPGPGPKMKLITILIENGTETYNSDGTDAAGNEILETYTAKLDGTEAPVDGIPYADTISTKRITLNHLATTFKKEGKVTMTLDIVVSPDGKTRTQTYTGRDERGHKVHDVLVFDKQA